ncbi:MAG: hypothetical protein WC979_08010 [Candidatus Pacearchaeota archaeon]|jgi:hypothetical protein
MKRTMLALMAVMIISVLAVGSVFAYQYGNKNNTNAVVDKVAAENAVESGDYATWKALHASSNGKMVSLINEGNFHLLKEMHEAQEAGDFAKVQEIKSELGFVSGNGQGKGMHMGQGKNGNCPYAN